MAKKALTVGELRNALKDVPDELEVRLSSDTGVDLGEGEIIIEDAYRTKYDLPDGKTFEDGTTGVDYFTIYANDQDVHTNEQDEEEEDCDGGWDGEYYGEDC